jgi:hypothetical protein
MGFILEKNETLLIFLRLFFKSPKSSSLKSLYNLFLIWFQSLSNFNKHLVFWWFLSLRNLKTVFWTVYSNSHQAVFLNTTSNDLFQIFTPSLFMGFILEKNEIFVILLETFFKSPKSSSLKSLYNLFSICFQSLSNFNKHLVFWWFLFLRNPKTM